MNGRNTLRGVLVLMLCAIAGIVGMLVAEGIWDRAFFALTALPLVLGGWRAWRHRGDGTRSED